VIALALWSLLAQGPVAPPHPAAQLRLVPRGDSVVVFLTGAPANGGFVLYRAAGAAAAARVTSHPIMPARSGVEAAGIIGADMEAVRRALRAATAEDAFRRLERDPLAAVVMSALYPKVGAALGRTYVDAGLARGGLYTYRVVFTDSAGRETPRALTGRVRVVDAPPAPPTGLKAQVGDRTVTVAWAYPRYRGDSGDNVFGFLVYRADAPAAPFHRITPTPVIRDDASPLEISDLDVTNGAEYRYRVTAVDVSGQEGAASAVLAVSPVDRTPPGIPADVAATPVTGGASIVWRMAPEPDAAGYQVERATRREGPYTRLTAALVPAGTPAFTDTAAAAGARYFYRVRAVDRSGNASEPSNPAIVTLPDVTPPPAPGGLDVRVAGRRVTLRWRPVAAADLAGYFVYRSGDGGRPIRLFREPRRDTVFVDSGAAGTGLPPGARLTWGVSAVDRTGNESGRTEGMAQIVDDEPPGPATALTLRDVDGRYVQVSWSASPAADVREYLLRRSAGDSTAIDLGHFHGRPPYLVRDSLVTHGRRYAYAVIAVDSAGNRSRPARDSLVFARLTPPPPPRHVALRRSAAGVTILWERVADPELAGYRVYRSALATGRFEPVNRTPVSATTLTDATGGPGFFYRVRAVDVSGNESEPSPPAGPVGESR